MPVFNNALAGAAGQSGGAAADYTIERSLRFDSASSSHLARTPSSAGNNKKWTWSGWVKRTKISGGYPRLFGTYTGNNFTGWDIEFKNDDRIEIHYYDGSSYVFRRITSAKYRDPSAWYHIVVAVDTTQATADNRIKLYVNGVQITTFDTNTNANQNYSTNINTAVEHRIGRNYSYSDFYLAEVHFLDGQTPGTSTDDASGSVTGTPNAEYLTDFGEFHATTGAWNPIEYTGSYNGPAGTNYSSQTITNENSGYPTARMFDGVYGSSASLNNSVIANQTNGTYSVYTFANPISYSSSVRIYGDLDTRSTDPDIKANNTSVTGFSDNTGLDGSNKKWYTVLSGSGTLSTVSLNQHSGYVAAIYAIEVDGTVLVSSTAPAGVNGFHLDFSDNSSDAALGTDSSGNNNTWTVNNFSATGTGVGTSGWTNKIGGPQSTWDSATTTSTVSSGTSWSTNGNNNTLHFDTQALGTHTITFTKTGGGNNIDFETSSSSNTGYSRVTNTASTITISSTSSSQTHSYNRYVRFSGSGSGQVTFSISGTALGTDSTGIDSLIDTPTNYEADSGNNGGNYATLNPLMNDSPGTLSNGNLELTGGSGAFHGFSTIGVSSGKWYAEVTGLTGGSGSNYLAGIADLTQLDGSNVFDAFSRGFGYRNDAKRINSNSAGNYGATYGIGDVIGVAADLDNGTITFYKNGTSQGTAYTTIPSGYTYHFAHFCRTSSDKVAWNFGQRPFAISSVPTGYKSLCTQNLDDPLISKGSNYFDIDTYSGTGNALERSEFSFKPDFLWIKRRSSTRQNIWIDSVRGVTKRLFSDSTESEATASNVLTSFDGDGFTLGTQADVNAQNETYVAWAWDAGNAANPTSVSAGSLNSSAYDQSQQWSNYLSASGGSGFANNGNGAFSGTRNFIDYTYVNGATSGTNYTMTFTPPSAISFTSSLRVQVEPSHGKVSIDGGTTYVNGGSTGLVTFNGPGSFTSITVADTRNQWSGEFAWVEVDGKLLVNTNATPPSVPSIATTTRANQTAGFSIVTATLPNYYTNYTIAHGLNATPHLIIGKNRASGNQWDVYHKDVGTGKLLRLNQTTEVQNATANQDSYYPTAPNSSVFGFVANNPTNNFVWYVFTSVKDFSSIGSYEANGGYTGPFVYTGFRPRWVMVKNADQPSNSYASWSIFDSERDTYNSDGPPSGPLYANHDEGEGHRGNASTESGHESIAIDFLSNGFLPRYNGTEVNGPANTTYIYLAFAENPFKISRAR